MGDPLAEKGGKSIGRPDGLERDNDAIISPAYKFHHKGDVPSNVQDKGELNAKYGNAYSKKK